ncbi:MAG: cell division protein SepF [Oscillospiraceae bacterium]|nr:cell division protein SepF [Oscillospiraceae bacterium]
MKILDSVIGFFAPQDDEGYENEPVRETRYERKEREPREVRDRDMDMHEREAAPKESYRAEREDAAPGGKQERGKVVNIQATAQLQVVLVKPEVFTDAKQIADHLISKKTVVLNLETASAENKRRIIDFLVGVAYANGGSLKPIANLTYIITPYNVGFIGEDLVGELESNGVIM